MTHELTVHVLAQRLAHAIHAQANHLADEPRRDLYRLLTAHFAIKANRLSQQLEPDQED